MKIQVHIAGAFQPFDGSRLDINRGVVGIAATDGKRDGILTNTFAIEGNYKGSKLMNKVCLAGDFPEGCCGNDRYACYVFPMIHFGTTPFSDTVTTFYRGNTPRLEPQLTMDDIHRSLRLTREWIAHNLTDEGKFVYYYYPSNGNYSKNNNMIRQLMTSRVLAEMSAEDATLRPLHEKNLTYIFRNWYFEDGDKGYILYKGKSKLGAIAMMVRTLVYSPYFSRYRQKVRNCVNTILSLMDKDGAFEPVYRWPDERDLDKERLNYFYTGEALLSLVEYFQKTGDSTAFLAAKKSQRYYMERYVNQLDTHYYPAYVPWHTMSMHALYHLTGDVDYRNAVFVLNDKLLEIHNQTGRPFPDLLGRYYNPRFHQYGTPHSSSDAVYTEGMAYAYELAKLAKDSVRIAGYGRACALGALNLINLQFQGPNMYYMQHPERVKGAIRINVVDNRIRNDTSQHTADAFTKLVQVMTNTELQHILAAFRRVYRIAEG